MCSDAGHQGLHRRLRAHTNINIVTPARGVLSRLSESRFSALRGTLKSAPAGSTETLEDPLERRRDPPSSPKRSKARKSAPNELFGVLGCGLDSSGDLETLGFP